MTGELAGLAEKAAAQVAAVLRNGRRVVPKALSGRVRSRLRQALNELATTIQRTHKIVAQARTRLAGQKPESATRLVSLHDPDARPIRKGRTGSPAGFGYKAQITDNADGIIPGYAVAYRVRGVDQPPQTLLRLGPHPPGWQARSRDLVRARGIHLQPGQDRRPGQVTSPAGQTPRTVPRQAGPGRTTRTFSGRSS